MKRSIAALSLLFVLTACVDTTGLSPKSSKTARGNVDSTVVLSEYGDFECPACRVANEKLVKPLLAKYGSTVRFEFKQFPLLTIHEFSMPMAEASECAADQGKFWEYVDMAYGSQLEMDKTGKTASTADIADWAKKLGIANDVYDRCTRSHIKRDAIMQEFDEGRKIGINGTPTFLVNGKAVEQNDLATISAALDAALKDVKTPAL